MKFYSRRVAAMALAAALSLPSIAVAAPRVRDAPERHDFVVRVLTTIHRLFGVPSTVEHATPPPHRPKPGVSSNVDAVVPPIPGPSKP